MARIPRQPQKIFAADADNNGVFGSGAAGTKILSNDIVELQSLPAFLEGWAVAVMGTRKFPALEEFQALTYIMTTQLCYLFQQGIPEWNSETTYYQNSIVCKPGTYELYGSKIDDNVNNALPDAVDDDNWDFLLDLSINDRTPFGVCEGIVNAYTVTTSPTFSTTINGFIFEAEINITNNGPSTLNPNSIGDMPVETAGAALVGGEMVAGQKYLFATGSDASAVQLLNPSPIIASDTKKGVVELATVEETITGTATDLAVTVADLIQLFVAGSQRAVGTSGWFKLPGNNADKPLIIQWTMGAQGGSETSQVVTFPIAFPNACVWCGVSTQIPVYGVIQNWMFQLIGSPTKTQVTVMQQQFSDPSLTGGTCAPLILAIGY